MLSLEKAFKEAQKVSYLEAQALLKDIGPEEPARQVIIQDKKLELLLQEVIALRVKITQLEAKLPKEQV